jgi:hypothetical protein
VTNKFTPAYVIARGLYKKECGEPLLPGNHDWDEMSLYERNQWVQTVEDVFEVMQELGYAVPDPKDKRK